MSQSRSNTKDGSISTSSICSDNLVFPIAAPTIIPAASATHSSVTNAPTLIKEQEILEISSLAKKINSLYQDLDKTTNVEDKISLLTNFFNDFFLNQSNEETRTFGLNNLKDYKVLIKKSGIFIYCESHHKLHMENFMCSYMEN